jgi:hypothetical protein
LNYEIYPYHVLVRLIPSQGLGFLNLNQNPVFAVAANILFLSPSRDRARAESITILPQGLGSFIDFMTRILKDFSQEKNGFVWP